MSEKEFSWKEKMVKRMGEGDPIAEKPHSILLIVVKLTLLCVAIAGVILIVNVIGLIAYGYIVGKAMFSSLTLSNLLFIEAIIMMLIGVVAFVRFIEALYYMRVPYPHGALSKLREFFERDRRGHRPLAVIMIIVGLILFLTAYIIGNLEYTIP